MPFKHGQQFGSILSVLFRCAYMHICIYVYTYESIWLHMLPFFSPLYSGLEWLKFSHSVLKGHIFCMWDHSYRCPLNCLHLLHVCFFDVLYPKTINTRPQDVFVVLEQIGWNKCSFIVAISSHPPLAVWVRETLFQLLSEPSVSEIKMKTLLATCVEEH